MDFKIIFFFTIVVFVFLFYIRKVNILKENFVNNMKKNKIREDFNSDIPSVNEIIPRKNVEESNVEESNVEESNVEESNVGKCNMASSQSNTKDDCLFGCGDKSEDMSVDDMMKTIEETEKLCDMIDEKDKIRREKEEIENVKQQIELNKKFLLQQKSQNKQIDDLQKIIKDMVFSNDMNKVAVEKCSGKTDECLTNKENKLSQILEEKKRKNKKLKVNLNLDQFGNNLKDALINQLGATGPEAQRLLELINSGQFSINDLNSSINTFYNGTTRNENDCPNCKIDLSKYIDRCKIPCRKCRDPAWGCPQDN